jgi:hypothetical protein
MPRHGATCHGDSKLNGYYDGSAQGFGYNFCPEEWVCFPKIQDLADMLAIMAWSNSGNYAGSGNCENSNRTKLKKLTYRELTANCSGIVRQ